jgi:hypothetical protein
MSVFPLTLTPQALFRRLRTTKDRPAAYPARLTGGREKIMLQGLGSRQSMQWLIRQ